MTEKFGATPLRTAVGAFALLASLAGISATSPHAEEMSAQTRATMCADRTARLDTLRDYAKATDDALEWAATEARGAAGPQRNYERKTVPQLEGSLKSLNKHQIPTVPLTVTLQLRDYVAALETWKVTGEIGEKPELASFFLRDNSRLQQQRAEQAREISLIKEEQDSLGCGVHESSGRYDDFSARLTALGARLSAEDYARLYADISVAIANYGHTVGWADGMDSAAPSNDPGRGLLDWNTHHNYAVGAGATVPGLVSARVTALYSALSPENFAQMEGQVSGLLTARGG